MPTKQQRVVKLAVIQMSMVPNDTKANIDKACDLVRQLSPKSVGVILLPELFAAQYFPQDAGDPRHYHLAIPSPEIDPNHPFWERMYQLAQEICAVLAVSFFEKAGLAHFNSLAVVDGQAPDSTTAFLKPVYRKLHIPHSPGYCEKFYFTPGDTPPTVYTTYTGLRIGVGVCWDQWFPELARCLALKGADILLYPTAIGSEPQDPDLDSRDHWRRTQQGHSAANMVPLMAANRTGVEVSSDGTSKIRFYGSSFITNNTGAIVAEAGRDDDGVVVVSPSIDLDKVAEERLAWGMFRDRRPEMYDVLTSLDGHVRDSDHPR